MNDEKIQRALEETQAQAEQVFNRAGDLLRKGAGKLKEAAEAASEAIRKDLEDRP